MGFCINSYTTAETIFSKARSKANGRPLGVSGYRLYKDGTDYVVKMYGGYELCRIRPDNTVLMTATPAGLGLNGQSLTTTLHRILPINTAQHKGKRRVDHTRVIDAAGEGIYNDPHGWHAYRARCQYLSTKSPIYFEGMIIDLTAQRVTNGRPDPVPVVDPAKRKEWLRMVRHFKKQLKTRFKLGAGEAIGAEIVAMRPDLRPVRGYDQWVDQILVWMQQDEYPMDLMTVFVWNAMPRWSPAVPTPEKCMGQVDWFFVKYSMDMRRKLGVISGGE